MVESGHPRQAGQRPFRTPCPIEHRRDRTALGSVALTTLDAEDQTRAAAEIAGMVTALG